MVDSIYLRGDMFFIHYVVEDLKWLIKPPGLALDFLTFASLQQTSRKLLDTILNLDIAAF